MVILPRPSITPKWACYTVVHRSITVMDQTIIIKITISSNKTILILEIVIITAINYKQMMLMMFDNIKQKQGITITLSCSVFWTK